MAIEIERKFLVTSDAWRASVRRAIPMAQGYVRSLDATVRVRIAGDEAFLTLKGRTTGVSRSEWEYPIPVTDARQMLDELCGGGQVIKTRHEVEHAGFVWEVDVFEGENTGLVMAEIELPSEDATFNLPVWAGEEVSGDARYYNSALAREPLGRG